jgi:hypothetical protein
MRHPVRSAFLLVLFCASEGYLAADPPPPAPTPFSEQALEAKWASIGDLGPLHPVQEATGSGHAADMKLGIPPHIDGEKVNSWSQILPAYTGTPNAEGYEPLPAEFSSGSTTLSSYPVFRDFVNTYMAAAVQAIYGPEFTTQPGKREFSGAAFTSVFDVPIDLNSAPGNTKDVIGYQTIYHKSQASTDLGGPAGFNAIHATTNLSVKEREGSTDDWRMRRWFVDLLCGGLSEAKLSAHQEDGTDGRILQGTNEAPLAIKFLLGCTTLVHQNAPTVPTGAQENLAEVEPEGVFANLPALMEENRTVHYAVAPAIDINLVKWIINSYLHVGRARGATARLDLADPTGYSSASPSAPPRRIGHWMGLQFSAHSTAPVSVASNDLGLLVQDQTIAASRTSPLDEKDGEVVPHHFSVMSAGVHVLGDGTADPARSGYSTDVVHVRDVLRVPLLSVPPVLNTIEPGTIVYANKPKAGAGDYAPGLYVCLIDSGGLKSWRRLRYDLTAANQSIVAGRIYRSRGKVVPQAANYSKEDIEDRIEAMGSSSFFKNNRLTARIEYGKGEKVIRVWASESIAPANQLSARRIERDGAIVNLASESGAPLDGGFQYTFTLDRLVPPGWTPRSAADIRAGVPPTRIGFEAGEGAQSTGSTLEVDLD